VDALEAAKLNASPASSRARSAATLAALIPSEIPGGNPVMEIASLGKIPRRPLTTVEPMLTIVVAAMIP
jgi:hypothetical protein